MIYTLFYSRLRDFDDETAERYQRRNDELERRASGRFEGFVDTKTFVAEDGERLTVVRFEDAAAQRAWAADADHAAAQGEGRREFYDEYRVTLLEELRTRGWMRAEERESSAR